jgi:hypothetical protein
MVQFSHNGVNIVKANYYRVLLTTVIIVAPIVLSVCGACEVIIEDAGRI